MPWNNLISPWVSKTGEGAVMSVTMITVPGMSNQVHAKNENDIIISAQQLQGHRATNAIDEQVLHRREQRVSERKMR